MATYNVIVLTYIKLASTIGEWIQFGKRSWRLSILDWREDKAGSGIERPTLVSHRNFFISLFIAMGNSYP